MAYDPAPALRRLLNDQSLLEETIHDYFRCSGVFVAKIGKAVESGDASALEKYAHTFKSVIAALTSGASLACAQALEDCGRTQLLGPSTRLYRELVVALADFNQDLELYVASLKRP